MSMIEERVGALRAAREILMDKPGAFSTASGPVPAEVIELAEWILTGQHIAPMQSGTTPPLVSWTAGGQAIARPLMSRMAGDPDDDATN